VGLFRENGVMGLGLGCFVYDTQMVDWKCCTLKGYTSSNGDDSWHINDCSTKQLHNQKAEPRRVAQRNRIVFIRSAMCKGGMSDFCHCNGEVSWTARSTPWYAPSAHVSIPMLTAIFDRHTGLKRPFLPRATVLTEHGSGWLHPYSVFYNCMHTDVQGPPRVPYAGQLWLSLGSF
jgi:hypothetical protein